MERLYRTTITIFTDYDPSELAPEDLVHAVAAGEAICTQQSTRPTDAFNAPMEARDFFGIEDDAEVEDLVDEIEVGEE